jgi:hypothetical protein
MAAESYIVQEENTSQQSKLADVLTLMAERMSSVPHSRVSEVESVNKSLTEQSFRLWAADYLLKNQPEEVLVRQGVFMAPASCIGYSALVSKGALKTEFLSTFTKFLLCEELVEVFRLALEKVIGQAQTMNIFSYSKEAFIILSMCDVPALLEEVSYLEMEKSISEMASNQAGVLKARCQECLRITSSASVTTIFDFASLLGFELALPAPEFPCYRKLIKRLDILPLELRSSTTDKSYDAASKKLVAKLETAKTWKDLVLFFITSLVVEGKLNRKGGRTIDFQMMKYTSESWLRAMGTVEESLLTRGPNVVLLIFRVMRLSFLQFAPMLMEPCMLTQLSETAFKMSQEIKGKYAGLIAAMEDAPKKREAPRENPNPRPPNPRIPLPPPTRVPRGDQPNPRPAPGGGKGGGKSFPPIPERELQPTMVGLFFRQEIRNAILADDDVDVQSRAKNARDVIMMVRYVTNGYGCPRGPRCDFERSRCDFGCHDASKIGPNKEFYDVKQDSMNRREEIRAALKTLRKWIKKQDKTKTLPDMNLPDSQTLLPLLPAFAGGSGGEAPTA